jgi:lipopolysaccharide export system permease protein
MRRLDRYIARRIWFTVLLVLLVVVGIDALTAFIDEAEDRSSTYDFALISRYVMLSLPGRCYEYLPFAALIGSLIGLGQLASTSELVVMRAAGVSNARLAAVTLTNALVIALLGFALGEYVAPQAEQAARSLRAVALYADRDARSDEGGIWKRDGNTFLHVRALRGDGRLYGVSAWEFDDAGRLLRSLFADGAVHVDGGWSLRDVRMTRLQDEQLYSDAQAAMLLPSNVTPRVLALENVSPGALALGDLRGYTVFLRSQGQDTADFELALWRKLLQPLTVAGLVLVAISFVFGPLRDGTLGFRIFAGVMVGVLFRLSQDLLGPASLVFGFPPIYAAALPIVLCAVVGVLLLRRA